MSPNYYRIIYLIDGKLEVGAWWPIDYPGILQLFSAARKGRLWDVETRA